MELKESYMKKQMKYNFLKQIMPITMLATLAISCVSSKVVLSNGADIGKYKYVVFGSEVSGDRNLDDVVMSVQNLIAETGLRVLPESDKSEIIEHFDSILTPYIHISSGDKTHITVTFYDYKDNQRIAIVKSSGMGMTVSNDHNIALNAMKKKLNNLFKK